MTIAVNSRAFIPARPCTDCGRWPCRCGQTVQSLIVGEPMAPPTEMCACGLAITASSRRLDHVIRAIAAHQVTSSHIGWWDRTEAQQEPPTARAPRTVIEVAPGGPRATVTRSRASAAPAGEPLRGVR